MVIKNYQRPRKDFLIWNHLLKTPFKFRQGQRLVTAATWQVGVVSSLKKQSFLGRFKDTFFLFRKFSLTPVIKNKSLFILLLAFMSCTSTKKLYKNLTSQPTSLSYLQDSKESKRKYQFAVDLDSVIIKNDFPEIAKLSKSKGTVIPALIYNSWKNEYHYSIGQNSIQEPIANFIEDAFNKETSRSGNYELKNNTETKLYIEIEEAYAKGPYMINGVFIFGLLFYSMSEQQFAGPGEAFSKMNYAISKNGKIIRTGKTESSRLTEPLKNVYKSDVELRRYFNTSLGEALSMTFKDNIEYIVRDVSRFVSIANN
ncbi:MAG: hypothetical protein AAGG59_01340 [Bacteroidota bacterium]